MKPSTFAEPRDFEPMRVAEDPTRMREILEQVLSPNAEHPYRIEECRIANVRRRDGTRGTAAYELRLTDPATGLSWEQLVTGVIFEGRRTRRLWESLRGAGPAHDAPPNQPPLPSFAYVPDLGMLVQVFPHDYRLPGLAALIAGPPPTILPDLLAAFGPGEWQTLAWRAHLVQYRVDMRAILRIDVRVTDSASGQEAEQRVYAKVYRDPEEASRAARRQEELYEALSADGARAAVAKLVACEEPLHTVVTEAVPGASLAKIIRRGHDLRTAVRLAARAVAEFHHLAVEAPPHGVADDTARLRESQVLLRSARPDLADVVSGMVDRIIAGLDDGPAMLIHGDLKPEHILIDGDRVALIDFDLMARADPVMDIAHMLTYLARAEEQSGTPSGQRSVAAKLFAEEYFSHVPNEWRTRLPLYHAMTSIAKAGGLSRKQPSGQADPVVAVLREGQALLSGAHDDLAVPSFKRRLTRARAH